ncbi:MAG: hypothetical protein AAF628_19375 [Planctomycetota bacterium]
MGAAVLQFGCTMQCPHGGLVQVVPGNARVRVGGALALLPTDMFTVVACPLNIGGKPQPCLSVDWSLEAVSAKIGGVGVLLESSIGLCKSAEQAPQGGVLVSGVQTKARAL